MDGDDNFGRREKEEGRGGGGGGNQNLPLIDNRTPVRFEQQLFKSYINVQLSGESNFQALLRAN